MKRIFIATGTAVLLAGCGASQPQATQNTTEAAPTCVSKDNNSQFDGFKLPQINALLTERAKTITAKPSDTAEWTAQAQKFADHFLDTIGIGQDSLCSGDYKDIQTLLGAEVDMEARAPKGHAGVLTGDAFKNYVRILYQQAGLSADRGYTQLDAQVDYTVNSVDQKRKDWKTN